MFKVPDGQDPYTVIGEYIQKHVTVIEDIIAVIDIDGNITKTLFMVDMDHDGYFVWYTDWYEGEKGVALIDFFPVSKAVKNVRCKNCVYWDTDWEPTVNFGYEVYHYCVILDRPVRSEFFCAEGLRISDEPDELINVSSI